MDLSAIALQGLSQAQFQLDKALQQSPAPVRSRRMEPLWIQWTLASETVALLSAKNVFSLDLKILKVASEVQKNLIDVIA